MSDSFRIKYMNAHRPTPEPDIDQCPDVESANYDYLAAGPSSTIAIGDYDLELNGLLFVTWIRESLPLAERIAAPTPDDWPPLRDDLPALPRNARVHFWIAAGMQQHAPILVFVVDDNKDGDRVLVYTRSSADVSGPKLLLLERDREEPYIFARGEVVSAITQCTEQYLDDLLAAFPALAQDETYQSQRKRLLALR